MIWFAKEFGYGDWSSVQDQFEALYMSLRAPAGMMLVCEDTIPMSRTTLYMALPTKGLAAAFPGFHEVTALPTRPSYLVGRQTEMEARFPNGPG